MADKTILIAIFGIFRVIFDILLQLTVMKHNSLYEQVKEGSKLVDGVLETLTKDDQ